MKLDPVKIPLQSHRLKYQQAKYPLTYVHMFVWKINSYQYTISKMYRCTYVWYYVELLRVLKWKYVHISGIRFKCANRIRICIRDCKFIEKYFMFVEWWMAWSHAMFMGSFTKEMKTRMLCAKRKCNLQTYNMYV